MEWLRGSTKVQEDESGVPGSGALQCFTLSVLRKVPAVMPIGTTRPGRGRAGVVSALRQNDHSTTLERLPGT